MNIHVLPLLLLKVCVTAVTQLTTATRTQITLDDCLWSVSAKNALQRSLTVCRRCSARNAPVECLILTSVLPAALLLCLSALSHRSRSCMTCVCLSACSTSPCATSATARCASSCQQSGAAKQPTRSTPSSSRRTTLLTTGRMLCHTQGYCSRRHLLWELPQQQQHPSTPAQQPDRTSHPQQRQGSTSTHQQQHRTALQGARASHGQVQRQHRGRGAAPHWWRGRAGASSSPASSTRCCPLCSTWPSSMHCGGSLTGRWRWHAARLTPLFELGGRAAAVFGPRVEV